MFSLEAIAVKLSGLHAVRRKRGGIVGNLLGLTVQPPEIKEQVSALEHSQLELKRRFFDCQREFESLERNIQSWEKSLERAQSWRMKLEAAAERDRRKKELMIELRAAAAATSRQTRNVGTSVKRKLSKQPWCPYCGGSLGDDPHADHIYPVSKGGRSVPRNMVHVCSGCNGKKRNLTLTAFIWKFNLDRAEIEKRLEQMNKEF